ncbi:MAG TPA: hypothetical protein PKD61_16335 [Polyangiaceae bacterium]|nr:hypothetical protein [Polyangiaceae bacterium]
MGRVLPNRLAALTPADRAASQVFCEQTAEVSRRLRIAGITSLEHLLAVSDSSLDAAGLDEWERARLQRSLARIPRPPQAKE